MAQSVAQRLARFRGGACHASMMSMGMHACRHARPDSYSVQSAVQQPAHSWRARATPPPFQQCDVLMLVGLPGGRHLTARMWQALLM